MPPIASKKKRLLAYIWDWLILFGPFVTSSVLWLLLKLGGHSFGVEGLMGIGAINPEEPATFERLLSTGTFAALGIIAILGLVWLLVFAIVNLVQVSRTGQTLGKKLVGIQIIYRETGEKVSVLRFLGRNILTYFVASILSNVFKIFSLFFLVDNGWILFDKNNEALHDKIWKTRVVVRQ